MESKLEISFSELESNKHFQNLMYGVWEEDYNEESLLYY